MRAGGADPVRRSAAQGRKILNSRDRGHLLQTRTVLDAAQQLLELRQGSPTGPRAAAFVFDANGNLRKKCEGGTVTRSGGDCSGASITVLSWNPYDQLVKVEKTGQATEERGGPIRLDRKLQQISGALRWRVIHGAARVAHATQTARGAVGNPVPHAAAFSAGRPAK